MNCETTIQNLPWFLNGTLDPGDEIAIRAHLDTCESCHHELLGTREAWQIFDAHLTPQDLTALALDGVEGEDATGLKPERHALIREHLEQCTACREEWQLIRESAAGFLQGEGVLPVQTPANDEAGLNEPGLSQASLWTWRLATVAAAILALVTATGWWISLQDRSALAEELAVLRTSSEDVEVARLAMKTSRQRLEAERQSAAERVAQLETQLAELGTPADLEPAINLPVVDIYPETMVLRGGGATSTEKVTIPADSEGLVLILGSQSNGDGPFTLEVADGARVAWRGDGLRRQERGEFTVTLPANLLPRGDLSLRVLNPAGEVVERYKLRVVRG